MVKLAELMLTTRLSAGTLSPTARVMTSPGTSSTAWIFCARPSRRTLASSGEYSIRACVT